MANEVTHTDAIADFYVDALQTATGTGLALAGLGLRFVTKGRDGDWSAQRQVREAMDAYLEGNANANTAGFVPSLWWFVGGVQTEPDDVIGDVTRAVHEARLVYLKDDTDETEPLSDIEADVQAILGVIKTNQWFETTALTGRTGALQYDLPTVDSIDLDADIGDPLRQLNPSLAAAEIVLTLVTTTSQ